MTQTLRRHVSSVACARVHEPHHFHFCAFKKFNKSVTMSVNGRVFAQVMVKPFQLRERAYVRMPSASLTTPYGRAFHHNRHHNPHHCGRETSSPFLSISFHYINVYSSSLQKKKQQKNRFPRRSRRRWRCRKAGTSRIRRRLYYRSAGISRHPRRRRVAGRRRTRRWSRCRRQRWYKRIERSYRRLWHERLQGRKRIAGTFGAQRISRYTYNHSSRE